jgi:hypothetical protein
MVQAPAEVVFAIDLFRNEPAAGLFCTAPLRKFMGLTRFLSSLAN